ncbi:MAG: thiol:disulfide interchange protein DsbA/DsbL [Pseudomonadota bacterium]
MKYVSIAVAVLALALGGWVYLRSNSPEPQPLAQPTEAVVEEVQLPEAEEPATDDTTETDSVMVEESSGEPEPEDDGEKPLILAQADTSAVGDWQFAEGTHFSRMVPAQPTVGGPDKIEVAEFFWYGCNHCFDFEPYINRWAEDLPANVRFVRVPALWNPLVRLHGQLYYTEEVLAASGKLEDREGFRQTVFLELHRRGNRLATEAAMIDVFERYGVSADDFKSTWGSFEVAQKMRVAEDLARRYGLASVPLVVVNGKYRTSGSEAGSYPKLLDVIDELVAREETMR